MKKIVTFLLCASLLGGNISVFAADTPMLVAEKPAVQDTNEPTTQKMEEIIKKVKPKLDIPDEAYNFEWDYEAGNYANDASWTFSWSSENADKVYRVRANNSGVITYYYLRDNTKNKVYSRFPSFKKADLEQKAKDFVKKIVPEIYNSLVLTDKGSASIYSNRYNYYFVRYENGIIFPQNTASVEIDYNTGDVVYFSTNFKTDLEIASCEEIIDEQKAKEILGTKLQMNLSYRIKSNYNEKNGEKQDDTVKAYLVYTPTSGYLSVDAKTGEIYTQNFSWDENTRADDVFASANGALKQESTAEDMEAGEYQLSEKELEQLSVLESLISKEKAIKVITDSDALYLDPNLTAVSAYLTKSGRYDYAVNNDNTKDNYYWNISFSNPKPKSDNGYDYSYANATVDAKDGTLISFNSSLRDYYYYENNKLAYPEIKFTQQQCKETADSFLKEQIPEKLQNSRLSSQNPTNIIEYKQTDDGRVATYGAYSYNYVRVNEGVDFTYNNIYVGVDGVSGKIFRYNYNWYETVEFESPEDAISSKEAYEIYIAQDGFGLNLELFSEYIYNKYLEEHKAEGKYLDYDALYDANYTTRLIYSVYEAGCNTVGALNGKLIDYNGEEYKPHKPYSYTDIGGHWAQDTIEIFADVSVGFEGRQFKPDEKITLGEFISLSQSAGLYFETDSEKEQEHLKRIDAVKYIIDSLGYKKIATLDIYSVSYDDSDQIGTQNMGYVALAKGLSIAKGNNNLFRPDDILTRAEALTIIRNALADIN